MDESTEEVERFDRTESSAGYVLRAAWGPTRFRALVFGPENGVAYADGETIRCVVGGVLHTMGRDGRACGAPERIAEPDALVLLAAHAPRALIARASEVVVVDLETREPLSRRGWSADLFAPHISADGTLVTRGSRVLRVTDDLELAPIEGRIAALSGDGSHVLALLDRGRLRIVRTGGGVVREWYGAQADSYALSSDGAYVAWIAHRFTPSAWHAGRGTPSPEWEDDLRVTIERTASGDDARHVPIAATGPLHFVRTEQGERLILSTRRGIEVIDAATGQRRTVATDAGRLLAVSHDGRRAAVGGDGARDVDLALGVAPGRRAAPTAVIGVAWSPSADRALVLRADGVLRLWDVAAWRCERVVSTRWRGLHVVLTDDGHLLTTERDGTVTCRTATGTLVWEHRLAPIPTWGSGFDIGGIEAPIVRATDVCVVGSWTRQGPLRVDREHEVDGRASEVLLDRATGAVRSTRETTAPNTLDPWRRWRAIRDAPPWDATLGAPVSIWPSPDERVLLVGTQSGQLLRLDRVP